MPPYPRTAHTGGGLTYVLPSAGGAGVDAVIRAAIAMDRWLPAPSQVEAITQRLRDYIGEACSALEKDPREEALAAVREAWHRLGLGPGDGYTSAVTYARGLGLVAKELRDLRRGPK
ncbi:DUF6415 family natural product biosynthesis protein [Streptomyces sp. VNUA116]|uniref:DUF6415 family natural product biosynthesis protein n=1 Tax=Streptomyces sp. VNUA116 TaxID=3062449 RepID=UPI00267527F6|nr:DUF6415 family natural product biosynthesis protein [Streptomyces sp. VNUA116]WKU45331.1 DUF6415 family natural product biosynthesis protein [Streptomyces sp. VNUA116]